MLKRFLVTSALFSSIVCGTSYKFQLETYALAYSASRSIKFVSFDEMNDIFYVAGQATVGQDFFISIYGAGNMTLMWDRVYQGPDNEAADMRCKVHKGSVLCAGKNFQYNQSKGVFYRTFSNGTLQQKYFPSSPLAGDVVMGTNEFYVCGFSNDKAIIWVLDEETLGRALIYSIPHQGHIPKKDIQIKTLQHERHGRFRHQ